MITGMTTDIDTRCERTELLKSQCACCRPAPADPDFVAAALADAGLSPTDALREPPKPRLEVTAAHFGMCSRCRGRIVPGEMIVPDGSSRWVHADGDCE